MGLSLTKGGNMSLTKAAGPAGLSAVTVGLGWDARSTDGSPFDLDSSAIVVGTSGRVVSDRHFVYFNQLESGDGAVRHAGDNLTGVGGGDDEQIHLDLTRMPADTDKVVVAVSIYDADNRRQNFGQVRNAFVRVVDAASGTELGRYDLSEDAATETAMIFAEIYRNGQEWKFRAVGQGYAAGLGGIARDYGVNV
ncbi:calcium homeostasis/redox stress adaptation protein [Angustibacter speluncae]